MKAFNIICYILGSIALLSGITLGIIKLAAVIKSMTLFSWAMFGVLIISLLAVRGIYLLVNKFT